MTIQFNITEPMPCTRNVWLTLENGSGKRIRYAEPADVLAAIMANRELREAVERAADSNMEAAFRAEATAHHAALKDRDDWKFRAETAESAYRFMVERAADPKLDGYRDLGARLAASEEARDAALARLREAERERDEARAERDKALQNGRYLVERNTAHFDAATRNHLEAQHLAEVVQERDSHIAKLERELAEAREAERIRLVSECDVRVASGLLDQSDAEELRARRALDGWEREKPTRRIGVMPYPGGDVAAWDNHVNGSYTTAPNHVGVAKKLGLF